MRVFENEPAVEFVHETGTGRNRRRIAIERQHARSSEGEKRPRIAAGTKCRIEIETARLRRKRG